MVVYFTGTGNSRYCAKKIAESLNDELINAFDFIKSGMTAELKSAKPWVFVSPTYAWQIPHVFEKFIREGYFAVNTDAYFVMTCGEDIGNAGEKIKKLCEDMTFNFKGVLPIVMPENYTALFKTPEKEEAKRIIDAAEPIIEAGIEKIRSGESFDEIAADSAAKCKSGIINRIFYKFIVKSKKFRVTNQCNGCGKCAKNCVLNNITIKYAKPVWGNECTHCMACINGCPQKAVEYGRRSKGKARYILEEKR